MHIFCEEKPVVLLHQAGSAEQDSGVSFGQGRRPGGVQRAKAEAAWACLQGGSSC